jgi:HSP20 family protein
MPYDLIPRSFFNFPSFNWDDEDQRPSSSTGLTVSEDEQHVYVEAALPGIDPDDVEITFDKGVLWIKGEAKEEEKKKKYYRKASTSFSYRVAVHGEIDLSKEPNAESQDGVMKITFMKHPHTQPKKISVKSKTKPKK